MKNVLIFPESIQCKKYKLLEKSCYFKKNIYFLKKIQFYGEKIEGNLDHVTQHPCKRILQFVHKLFNVDLQILKNFFKLFEIILGRFYRKTYLLEALVSTSEIEAG